MTGSSAAWSADRLRAAPIEPVGRFADASNATLLVRLCDRDQPALEDLAAQLGRQPGLEDLPAADLAVYKPMRGEAPLWDFPVGTLHRREVAAHEIVVALGWDLVPLTVLREDGPYGPGSLQRFVAHDPGLHYFRLLETGVADVIEQLRRMVVFDLVIDNADRKAGHVLLADERRDAAPAVADRRPAPSFASDELPGPRAGVPVGEQVAGHVQVVDHGVALNVDHKLRTVAWEFAGEPLPEGAVEALTGLAAGLDADVGERLATLLNDDELAVLRARVERLIELPALPGPIGPRPYPWPPI